MRRAAFVACLAAVLCSQPSAAYVSMSPQSEAAATSYQSRFELSGLLLRAAVVCEREGQRLTEAGMRVVGSPELRAISKGFPDKTREWTAAGAELFNARVMTDGLSAACRTASDARDEADRVSGKAGEAEVVPAGEDRCRVMDPTNTPLNVRSEPNGKILRTIRNGVLVTVLKKSADDRGRSWAYISDRTTGQSIGWVFREFISCF